MIDKHSKLQGNGTFVVTLAHPQNTTHAPNTHTPTHTAHAHVLARTLTLARTVRSNGATVDTPQNDRWLLCRCGVEQRAQRGHRRLPPNDDDGDVADDDAAAAAADA